ncbi:ComEA family DNA-binding protein [Roseburia sp. OF03-24]|jgi:competence protein ComEA|uniref:helix-hairpin-helix domain-containing protein n=1 Tax=Roseburia TaxID=841 RepID=UPI000E517375|nr:MULTISPECIES: helix-hairpin-helix domain-containing protein [Roseburia]RGX94565.1 ComEA family DNA-binding protein [Roseburia sp. OF03-24]RHF95207.1 ComEA family DNA-binding protein [Roseburia sp. AM23-20]UMY99091.1 helix-hairpin-helix domain-containing protein [Roseburia rectibacter]
MIKKIIKVLCFSCFCLLAAACGERENVYFQTETSVAGTQQNEDVAATEIMAENNADDTQTAGSDKKRFVYICGAVNVPGVYEVEQNARLYEVVEAAGGLREDAAEESVNQARQIEDGEMIRILTQEEAAQAGDEEAGEGAENDVKAETANDSDGRIDLNLATVAELMTLPGIGQAKADSIVRYREKNGAFSSIEEIKQVEGIKEGVYNRIKDNIKVK